MIKEFNKKLQAYEKQHRELKKQFEKIIKDKKIPLKKRWEFWNKAPESLKNHRSYIPTFRDEKATKGEKALTQWIDSFDDMRGSVDVSKFLWETIIFVVEPERLDENETVEDSTIFTDINEIIALMEQVLKMNLGSFDWDW